jgi:O-antigen biosynthesis protein
MNVLLMTSPIPLRTPFPKWERSFPLGIGFLISVLRQAGHDVHFIDNGLGPNDVLEGDFLTRNRIDCVGLHSPSLHFSETLRVLEELQQKRERGIWKGRLIIGGPHPSICPEAIPDYVDCVVQGEGEHAIVDAVEGHSPRLVKCPRIKDLDSLPRPAYDCFANLPYNLHVPDFKAKPVFTMNTSRGCPFSCAFCSIQSLWGRQYTTFSPERIVDDIKFLQGTFGVQGINFREDNFTAIPNRVRSVCELMVREELGVSWMCEARANDLDREMLSLMKRAGCKAIYIGAESGSQRVLDLMHKEIRVEDTVRMVELCKELDINIFTSFVVGFPGETARERVETMDFIEKLAPSRYSIAVYTGIPGSVAYTEAMKNNGFAYVNESGIGYIQEHDLLVDEVYGGIKEALIPRSDGNRPVKVSKSKLFNYRELRNPAFRRKLAVYRRFSARAHRRRGNRLRAIRYYSSAVGLDPFHTRNWKALFSEIVGSRASRWVSRFYHRVLDGKLAAPPHTTDRIRIPK